MDYIFRWLVSKFLDGDAEGRCEATLEDRLTRRCRDL